MDEHPKDGSSAGLAREFGPPTGLEEGKTVPQLGGETVQQLGVESLTFTSSAATSGGAYAHRVLHSLRRIIRAIDLHSRKLLADYNITGPQLVCLLSVKEGEPVTPSTIARTVHLSPSTVIGILDRLEHRGLVRRERDSKDRRLVRVSLTGQGKALIARAPSPLQDKLAEALGSLPEEEQSMIAESLDRVVEMMEFRQFAAATPSEEAGPAPPANEAEDYRSGGRA